MAKQSQRMINLVAARKANQAEMREQERQAKQSDKGVSAYSRISSAKQLTHLQPYFNCKAAIGAIVGKEISWDQLAEIVKEFDRTVNG